MLAWIFGVLVDMLVTVPTVRASPRSCHSFPWRLLALCLSAESRPAALQLTENGGIKLVGSMTDWSLIVL